MNSLFLNNITTKFYLNPETNIEFAVPLSSAGVLLSLKESNYKPILITQNLLKITGTEKYLNRKNIKDVDFLIQNSVIPNYNYRDFEKNIKDAVQDGNELTTRFSVEDDVPFYNRQIQIKYTPKFIPLYIKNENASFIYFYLDQSVYSSNPKTINDYKKIISNNENKTRLVYDITDRSVLEINNKFEIEYYNQKSLDFFPDLANGQRHKFLNLWSFENQNKLTNTIGKLEYGTHEEIVLYEDKNGESMRFQVKINNLNTQRSKRINLLIYIANLDHLNKSEKEIWRKSILLQTFTLVGQELESNPDSFITNSARVLLNTFSLDNMYFLPFGQDHEDHYIQDFSSMTKIDLEKKEFDAYKTHFKTSLKGSIKKIPFSPTLTITSNRTPSDHGQLIGIPITINKQQLGLMIYTTADNTIKSDEAQLLYSMTVIIYQLHYRQLFNIDKKVLPIES
jgi:hypothetical protein